MNETYADKGDDYDADFHASQFDEAMDSVDKRYQKAQAEYRAAVDGADHGRVAYEARRGITELAVLEELARLAEKLKEAFHGEGHNGRSVSDRVEYFYHYEVERLAVLTDRTTQAKGGDFAWRIEAAAEIEAAARIVRALRYLLFYGSTAGRV